jgi:hypothetical protein
MFICTASIYFRKMLSSSSLICTWISDFILSMLFIYPNKPVETNKIKYMDHIVISYNMQDNIRDKIMLRFFLSATLFSGILHDYVFTVYPFGAPDFTPRFSGVRVIRSLVLCVYFVDRCLSLCSFSFDHCVVCPLRNLITPLVSSNSTYILRSQTKDELIPNQNNMS